jgi:ABC-type polysaccharide/polyol phosphate export permease
MFYEERRSSLWAGAFTILTLIFHNAVRGIRKSHRNAALAILLNMFQTMIMIGIFFFLFDLLGLRRAAIRGDFLLYVMSGIFVFMTHIKALGSVAGADLPTSAALQHLPMTQLVAVCASAVSALYIQITSMGAILLLYHLLWTPIEIHQPVNAAMMLVLAWFSGCAAGTILLALKPWFPKTSQTVMQVYTRANMFASGKMFVANQMPSYMIAMFWWNPLFHIIDQGRGFTFVNYNPMKSSLMYPIWVSAILLVIGILALSFTSKHASLSWDAAR